MPASVGDQRWSQVGTNAAGDKVYARHGSSAAVTREDMTKEQLSAELESRGLPKTGSKDELIQRLNEADAA